MKYNSQDLLIAKWKKNVWLTRKNLLKNNFRGNLKTARWNLEDELKPH